MITIELSEEQSISLEQLITGVLSDLKRTKSNNELKLNNHLSGISPDITNEVWNTEALRRAAFLQREIIKNENDIYLLEDILDKIYKNKNDQPTTRSKKNRKG